MCTIYETGQGWALHAYSPPRSMQGWPQRDLLSVIGLNEAGFRVAYLPLDPRESGLRMENLPILSSLF